MTICGVEFKATFDLPATFTDEWLDAVYTSLEKNMAIESIDMVVNEEAGEIAFVFGIDDFLESGAEFIMDVGRTALDRAFEDAAGPNTRAEENDLEASDVFAFA
jgi:hypothetical protein